jgi:hypothetical protein
MTLYNIHLYREMRLFFPGIEAPAPDEAARIAADKLTQDAEYAEDCDGENLAALVDVVGDDQYEQSQMIDFESERLRKAAPALLNALKRVSDALHDILGAADNGHPYSPDELARLFIEDWNVAQAALAQPDAA